jgi:acetyl-CoA carboxylase biotin carboxyl carrier protein
VSPAQGPGAQEIRAELPASVVAVVARVGEDLGATDTVVLLDSMKMEIPVVPERPGRVTEICVEVGDTVRDGDLIARLS